MIMLSPPLCITRAEVDRIVDIIDSSLTEVEKHYGYLLTLLTARPGGGDGSMT